MCFDFLISYFFLFQLFHFNFFSFFFFFLHLTKNVSWLVSLGLLCLDFFVLTFRFWLLDFTLWVSNFWFSILGYLHIFLDFIFCLLCFELCVLFLSKFQPARSSSSWHETKRFSRTTEWLGNPFLGRPAATPGPETRRCSPIHNRPFLCLINPCSKSTSFPTLNFYFYFIKKKIMQFHNMCVWNIC